MQVQGTLKSLLQHQSSKASLLRCSAFFIVQLSHPYMITGKSTALTRRTFAGKMMSLLFNMLSRLVIAFLLRSKPYVSKNQPCLLPLEPPSHLPPIPAFYDVTEPLLGFSESNSKFPLALLTGISSRNGFWRGPVWDPQP